MNRTDFVWDEFWWKTSVRVGDVDVPLIYAPQARDERPLEEAEIASIAWAVDNLPSLWGALYAPVHSYYESFRAEPDGLDPDDLPAVASAEEVMEMLEPDEIYVHQVSRDGRPYVGFAFGCPWDEEHGLGVLVNGTRVVEIGGVDTAVLLWMARRDSEQVEFQPLRRAQ